MKEPTKAFPYKPPSIEIKQRFSYIFANQFSLKSRYLKLFFDQETLLLRSMYKPSFNIVPTNPPNINLLFIRILSLWILNCN